MNTTHSMDDGKTRWNCVQCGAKLKAPSENAGRTIPCPKCLTKQAIPNTSSRSKGKPPSKANSTSDANWHYRLADKTHGPITKEALKSLLLSGQIRPDSLVWTNGMANWMPAGNVSELQNQQKGKPPSKANAKSDANWHYRLADKTHGPITKEVLISLLLSRQIRPDSLVWTDGMANWSPAGNVNELKTPIETNHPVEPAPEKPNIPASSRSKPKPKGHLRLFANIPPLQTPLLNLAQAAFSRQAAIAGRLSELSQKEFSGGGLTQEEQSVKAMLENYAIGSAQDIEKIREEAMLLFSQAHTSIANIKQQLVNLNANFAFGGIKLDSYLRDERYLRHQMRLLERELKSHQICTKAKSAEDVGGVSAAPIEESVLASKKGCGNSITTKTSLGFWTHIFPWKARNKFSNFGAFIAACAMLVSLFFPWVFVLYGYQLRATTVIALVGALGYGYFSFVHSPLKKWILVVWTFLLFLFPLVSVFQNFKEYWEFGFDLFAMFGIGAYIYFFALIFQAVIASRMVLNAGMVSSASGLALPSLTLVDRGEWKHTLPWQGNDFVFRTISLVAGVVMFVGLALPWLTIRINGSVLMSIKGFEIPFWAFLFSVFSAIYVYLAFVEAWKKKWAYMASCIFVLFSLAGFLVTMYFNSDKPLAVKGDDAIQHSVARLSEQDTDCDNVCAESIHAENSLRSTHLYRKFPETQYRHLKGFDTIFSDVRPVIARGTLFPISSPKSNFLGDGVLGYGGRSLLGLTQVFETSITASNFPAFLQWDRQFEEDFERSRQQAEREMMRAFEGIGKQRGKRDRSLRGELAFLRFLSIGFYLFLAASIFHLFEMVRLLTKKYYYI